MKIFTQSAADFLDEWFESDEIKVTLATDGVIGANGGPRSPGTAYILLHHVMGSVGGKRGLWGFVRGGMGAVSNAIAESAASRGAEIRTNAGVKSIRVENGRARGVVLEGGEEIEAPIVASNLTPQIDLPAFGRSARTCPPICSTPSANFGAKAPPARSTWRSTACPISARCPATPGPQHRATMHICPSIDYVERAWDDAKYGRPSQSPLLELTIPTMYDPSLAPPGKHIMGSSCNTRLTRCATRIGTNCASPSPTACST